MAQYLPYLLAVIILVAAVSFIWLREQANAKTESAFVRLLEKAEEMLEDERRSHHATTDRLHATKNLPPAEINLTERYEKIQEEQQERKELERKNGGPIRTGPYRIGSVDKVTEQMRNEVRQRHEKTEELRQLAEKKRQNGSNP